MLLKNCSIFMDSHKMTLPSLSRDFKVNYKGFTNAIKVEIKSKNNFYFRFSACNIPIDMVYLLCVMEQLVARRAHNPKVRGSSPLNATTTLSGRELNLQNLLWLFCATGHQYLHQKIYSEPLTLTVLGCTFRSPGPKFFYMASLQQLYRVAKRKVDE
jgi:hypothetical protein